MKAVNNSNAKTKTPMLTGYTITTLLLYTHKLAIIIIPDLSQFRDHSYCM